MNQDTVPRGIEPDFPPLPEQLPRGEGAFSISGAWPRFLFSACVLKIGIGAFVRLSPLNGTLGNSNLYYYLKKAKSQSKKNGL